MTTTKLIGQVKVGFAFDRHVGGKFRQGAVTLQFDGTRAYSFKSEALWPSAENYEDLIRKTIEDTLQMVQGHLDSPEVILKNIQWNEVSSCQLGFECAARAATLAAFEV